MTFGMKTIERKQRSIKFRQRTRIIAFNRELGLKGERGEALDRSIRTQNSKQAN